MPRPRRSRTGASESPSEEPGIGRVASDGDAARSEQRDEVVQEVARDRRARAVAPVGGEAEVSPARARARRARARMCSQPNAERGEQRSRRPAASRREPALQAGRGTGAPRRSQARRHCRGTRSRARSRAAPRPATPREMPTTTLPSSVRVNGERRVDRIARARPCRSRARSRALVGRRLAPSPSRCVTGPGSATATAIASAASPTSMPIISKPSRAGFVFTKATRWRTCADSQYHADSDARRRVRMRVQCIHAPRR